MAVTRRARIFRDGKPKTDVVDPMSPGDELQSNKNMSGGRDLARPLEPGVHKQGTVMLSGRKGRRGRSR